MPEFARTSDGVNIAYEVVGHGTPIVLVHGFASDRVQNWKAPGWYDVLTAAGFLIIALDCRGHGESDKPHDASFYGHRAMTRDVLAVMDAEHIECAPVLGYSMGGFIAIAMLMAHEHRIVKAAIGGVGASYFDTAAAGRDRVGDPAVRDRIADALLVEDKRAITDPTAKAFREFAEQPGKDRRALAACMRARPENYSRAELARASRPVLVVCGENDAMTGPPEPLASAFAGGRAVTVPRRDHMTTVGDKVFKSVVVEFLSA